MYKKKKIIKSFEEYIETRLTYEEIKEIEAEIEKELEPINNNDPIATSQAFEGEQ